MPACYGVHHVHTSRHVTSTTRECRSAEGQAGPIEHKGYAYAALALPPPPILTLRGMTPPIPVPGGP